MNRKASARRRRRVWRKPPLEIGQILAWADEHVRLTGRWPQRQMGRVRGTLEENWQSVDNALRLGLRGMPGGDSLARLLARHRGVRNRKALPRLSIAQIVGWADEHFRRTGRWPNPHSGPIHGTRHENWLGVQNALRRGDRGLPGGDSLAQLFARERGVRNRSRLPRYRIADILRWADAHFAQTGQWPLMESGPIAEAPGETWTAVQDALYRGGRGLPGGSSLPRLLLRRRGVGRAVSLRPLTSGQILAWADAYHERHGRWPTIYAGKIPEAAPLTWLAVSSALRKGSHGLPGGSSLPRLLKQERQARSRAYAPRLTERQILAWADAHQRRFGRWPSSLSGAIRDTPGETWNAVDLALSGGYRGLPGGSSLARLLDARRHSSRNSSRRR